MGSFNEHQKCIDRHAITTLTSDTFRAPSTRQEQGLDHRRQAPTAKRRPCWAPAAAAYQRRVITTTFIMDPWLPYLMYSGLTLLSGTIPLLLLPETLPKSPAEPESSCDASVDEDHEQPEPPDTGSLPPARSTLTSRFRPLMRRNVIAVLLAFFVSALGRQSTSFLLQFIRQRFNWTFEKVRPLCMKP